MKDQLKGDVETLRHLVSKLQKGTTIVNNSNYFPVPPGEPIPDPPPNPPPGGGGGGGGGFPYLWIDGTTIYFVNPLTTGDIRIYSLTGGIAIGAGQVSGEPTDGEILLNPSVAVRVKTALIIPVL